MAERRPDSLLFSLKELRRIEEDRVKQEEDDVKRRREAEVQAQEEAVRRIQAEEERKRQEAEDKIRREQEEKERLQREGQLRLQEAERRARVEAEMQLQRQRMAMEMEAQSAQRKSMLWKSLVGLFILFIIVGGGLGYNFYSKSQEAEKLRLANDAKEKEIAKILKDAEDRDRVAQEQQNQLNKKIEDLTRQMLDAKDEGKRELLRKQLDAQRQQQQRLADARAREQAAARKKAKQIRLLKSSDPLGNIGL
jgi:hypothetical protein